MGKSFAPIHTPMVEHSNDDNERAASLERHTQQAFENDMLHLRRQQSNTWKAHLEGMGNDEEQFCRHSHISLDMLYRITLMDGGRHIPAKTSLAQ